MSGDNDHNNTGKHSRDEHKPSSAPLNENITKDQQAAHNKQMKKDKSEDIYAKDEKPLKHKTFAQKVSHVKQSAKETLSNIGEKVHSGAKVVKKSASKLAHNIKDAAKDKAGELEKEGKSWSKKVRDSKINININRER